MDGTQEITVKGINVKDEHGLVITTLKPSSTYGSELILFNAKGKRQLRMFGGYLSLGGQIEIYNPDEKKP